MVGTGCEKAAVKDDARPVSVLARTRCRQADDSAYTRPSKPALALWLTIATVGSEV